MSVWKGQGVLPSGRVAVTVLRQRTNPKPLAPLSPIYSSQTHSLPGSEAICEQIAALFIIKNAPCYSPSPLSLYWSKRDQYVWFASIQKYIIKLGLASLFSNRENCLRNPGKGINRTRYRASWESSWTESKACLTRPVCITQRQLRCGLGGG